MLEHYNIRRLLINKLLSKLFAVPKMSEYSASELSRVLNSVKHVLQALKTLGGPVEHWNFITVFLLTRKVTSKIQAKWEDLLNRSEDPTDPSSFQELCKFLESERKGLASLESTNEFHDDPLSALEKETSKVIKSLTAAKKNRKTVVHYYFVE